MNVRSTILLWIIAVLGVVVVWLLDRGDLASGATAARRPLIAEGTLDPDHLTRIELRRAGTPEMVFERRGSEWMQTSPLVHPVDPYSVTQLARLARELVVVDTVTPAELSGSLTPHTLGLDPPAAELTMSGPEGAVALELGRRGLGGLAYIALAGADDVAVVAGELHARAIDMDPREWRDRTIFRDVGVDATRVEIVAAETVTVLERDRKTWRMSKPVATRLGQVARDELFQALGRAKAGGFVLDHPETLGHFGLEEPAGIVTVVTARPVTRDGVVQHVMDAQTLWVGARMGVGTQDRFGMVEGRDTVIRLPDAVLSVLFRRPALLASPVASGIAAADVKSIQINGRDGALELTRDLDRWLRADDDGRKVDAKRVEALLDVLTVRPASEVMINPYPRELQVATVTLVGFTGRPLDTVRVARESADGRWVLENGDDVLRLFPADTGLPLTPAEW